MNFYSKKLALEICNRDTFAIPFTITGHVPGETEKFLFTIRKMPENTNFMGVPPVKGQIVFQKTIFKRDTIPITDNNGDTVGCYFFVKATKEEAAAVPEGLNSYDLTLIDDEVGLELDIVPPNALFVRGVLRYE